ncbi:MAG: PepSY domain-containing protein [Nitrospirales bacterium]|nr:PepSY domain-containing protein [Nitrospira sp.]MDR4501108.1 PepSY domain-containing protein [Nitrospirales bacterium]
MKHARFLMFFTALSIMLGVGFGTDMASANSHKKLLPTSEAIKIVEAQYYGQVETVHFRSTKGGSPYYQVTVFSDADGKELKDVLVDAVTGKVKEVFVHPDLVLKEMGH